MCYYATKERQVLNNLSYNYNQWKGKDPHRDSMFVDIYLILLPYILFRGSIRILSHFLYSHYFLGRHVRSSAESEERWLRRKTVRGPQPESSIQKHTYYSFINSSIIY